MLPTKAFNFGMIFCLGLMSLFSGSAAKILRVSETLRVSDTETQGILDEERPLPEGVSRDWFSQAQQAIAESEYEVTWQEQTYLPDYPAAFQAPNRAHNLRAYFLPQGIIVIPRTWEEGVEGPPWRLEMSLSGYRFGEASKTLETSELFPEGNRIEYRRGALEEWYVNDPKGLEQGFTFDLSNELETSQVSLELNLGGDLIPELTGDGSAIELSTSDGTRLLSYGDLHAFDAIGRGLPIHMESNPAGEKKQFRMVIDATGASSPVTVDPTLIALPTDDYDWMVDGDYAQAKFGASVSTAGDVNADGFSDVIIGAPGFDIGQDDEGLVFVFYGGAPEPNTIYDWSAQSNMANAQLGFSVGLAGDVNGDLVSDIIVGAPYYNNGQAGEGCAFVWYGSNTGLGVDGTPTNADWMAESNEPNANLGWSVGTAGNVNDIAGLSDVIVGAPYHTNGQLSEGAAYVWHGSSLGLTPGTNGTPLNANWVKESGRTNAQFGFSVSTAGDVNGNGYDDVIVGAPGYPEPETGEGHAFVYLGSSTGLNTSPNWHGEGNQIDAHYGFSVSTAGDMNGDGYSEVIVGVPDLDCVEYGWGVDAGEVFIYRGSSSGLETEPIWVNKSSTYGVRLGFTVGLAGDINGDGYADAFYGRQDFLFIDLGGSDWGAYDGGDWYAMIPFTSVGVAGDVNGDGLSDIIVGDSNYGVAPEANEGAAYLYYGSQIGVADSHAWQATHGQDDAQFGFSVSSAGDVNGDGYADMVIGAPFFENDSSVQLGGAYTWYGSSTGMGADGYGGRWIEPGNFDWRAVGDLGGSQFGASVSTAGDVNDDGYSDVIVGAPLYDSGQTDEGKVFVFHGSSSGLHNTPDWTGQGDCANAHLGFSVSTAGDVNGDGFSEILVGAPTNNYYAEDNGMVLSWYGSSQGLGANGTMWNFDWIDYVYQADAQFGYSVATAGDVNRDGYSDVIVGAPYYNFPTNNEGRAFVYLGSEAGLSNSPDWYASSNGQPGADFGYSVSTAGDVNGDGFSDVIIGAPTDRITVENLREGVIYVYHGSSGALPDDPDWYGNANLPERRLGYSVSTAGDMNGDGFADIIAGWVSNTDPVNSNGAKLWFGSEEGLGENGNSGNADWSGGYGYCVGTAGDVNGDGYADVFTTNPLEPYYFGRVLLYSIFEDSPDMHPRQIRAIEYGIPVSPLGKSDALNMVVINLKLRSPMGRSIVGIQIQAAPLGVPFAEHLSAKDQVYGFVDSNTSGQEESAWVIGLYPNTPYHWRSRVLYHPGNRMGQVGSRWIHVPWNGWNEMDFRTLFGVFFPVVIKN